MSLLTEALMFGRFARDLPRFLRTRMTLEDARETIRRRLDSREENFLQLVERSVYGHSPSPYLPLLRSARCELGDLRAMVRSRGLETTLSELRSAGVYVSFEEFKGRAPIVRGDMVRPVSTRDFDNPLVRSHYRAQSGGSTGAPTQLPMNLGQILSRTANYLVGGDAHGLAGAPTGLWRGIPPDNTGLSNVLRGVISDNVPRRWFCPLMGEDLDPALKYRLATRAILEMARLSGSSPPRPENVPLDQAGRVARWAERTARAEGACLLRASVSLSLRVGIAAREEGVDLHGVSFMGGGEPPTPAKVEGITRTGARWIPTYAFVEAGSIGLGCAHPVDGNDLHFFRDMHALIQHARVVPGTEVTVAAFHFTSLLPTAARVLLNVESDDFGVIEQRACGCPLETVGFVDHIREVRSFRKLTGEGVTLIGSEMIRILEEVLPARFGGSALDYQLLEEEDGDGLTRLHLVVSPRIRDVDDDALVEAVLGELGRGSVAADLARALWTQAGTLRVKRMEPVWGLRGKLQPLRAERLP